MISDRAIENAIALDNKHGVSAKFTNALSSFDAKYKATDKAKGIDASYGITDKANQGWRGINSYFEKALNTPTGQRLAAFYTQGDKQVRDIHTEARRLADLKGGKPTPAEGLVKVPGSEKTTCQCAGNTGTCPCAEDQCACNGCAKSSVSGEKSAAAAPTTATAPTTAAAPTADTKTG